MKKKPPFSNAHALITREIMRSRVNKLTSVFHASVLLLIMNFVITLSK